jgi:hypothetical protein
MNYPAHIGVRRGIILKCILSIGCKCLNFVRLIRINTSSGFREHVTELWSGGLRRRSEAAVLLGLWFRIPPGAWMSVCCECCVLSGRGLCDELITCPEKSYTVVPR